MQRITGERRSLVVLAIRMALNVHIGKGPMILHAITRHILKGGGRRRAGTSDMANRSTEQDRHEKQLSCMV